MSAEPDLPRPRARHDRISESAIRLVHSVVKEIDCIKHLSARLCGDARPETRADRDLESIRRLSWSAACEMHRFLERSYELQNSEESAGYALIVPDLINYCTRRVERQGRASVHLRIDRSAERSCVPEVTVHALIAILENAVDFHRGSNPIVVDVSVDDSRVRITTTDSGPGMSPEVLSLCRVRGFTTRRADGGHGLGLATARQVMHEIGGRLELKSRVREGTCAVLVVPRLAP